MRKLFLKILIILLALPLSNAWGQEHILTGVVRDAKGGLPMATVYIQDKNNRALGGISTNENGEYQLRIPSDFVVANIVFSFIGYKTKVVPYTKQPVINVVLEENLTQLDEVLVETAAINRDAMGINTKMLGGAREKIDLDDLQNMSVTSVADMLQGRLANVDIVATSGAPGAKMSMRIRGTASLNASNEPLIVIDDVPVETNISESFDFTTATEEDFGALVNISPDDIQTIEVLKDASATAIWGAQAANGVLVITTKQGKVSKPVFTLTEKISTNIEPPRVPMLNAKEYVTLMQDAIWNNVRDGEYKNLSLLKKYKDILYDPTYLYFGEFNQDVDWLDYIVARPLNSETNFSMSGGGDKATYRFSLGYLTEKGTTVGESFQRVTARLSLDYRLSKKFKIGSKFAYAEGDRGGNLGNPRNISLQKMPNMTPFVLDADGLFTDEYFTPPSDCIQGLMSHPIALARESRENLVNRDMSINVNLDYSITTALRFSANGAFNLSASRIKTFSPASATGLPVNNSDYNKAEENMSNMNKLYLNARLNYNKRFTNHLISAAIGFQANDAASGSYSSATGGNASESMGDPSANGRLLGLGAGKSQNRWVAFIGTVVYSYKDKYNVNLAGRMNGNSNTGRQSRWGTFPSVNGSWHIHREDFAKEANWLTEAIIRLGWGRSGTSPSGSSTYAGTFGALDDVYVDETAIKPNSMQLNALKWETTTQMNYGTDLTFLEDRLNFTFDYYTKVTSDLLQKDMSIQSTTGYSSVPWFNDGKISNKGWEVTMKLNRIVDISGFRVGLSFNISRNRNVVEKLPMTLEYQQAKIANGAYSNKVIAGRPVGSFFGFRSLGVYQNFDETIARDKFGNAIRDVNGDVLTTRINGTHRQRPGDAKYYDLNYDGIINQYDIVYLGNAMPLMLGGGSLTMTYKGWYFRTSVAYRIGQSIVNMARLNSERMDNANNQSTAVLRRWLYEGDNTEMPRALWGTNYNALGSDRYVEKASFLKVKDITLSYRFQKNVLQYVHLRGLSMYLTCYDPFTITNYKGQDPEVGIPSHFSTLAADNSLSPRSRRFAFGMTVDF